MKTKLETKKALKQDSISATVTTTVSLTIKGHTFDLSLEELEHIYGIIGRALGKNKEQRPIVTDEYKKMIEEAAKKQLPPPIWPAQPYVPPHNFPSPRRPEWRPPEVWCSIAETPASKITFGGS
jgi:hypothetical protein